MPSPIRAVVFDLDGLLIDSEVVWNRVRSDVAAERGVAWTEGDQRAVMGVSTAAWTAYMIDRLGLDLTPVTVENVLPVADQPLGMGDGIGVDCVGGHTPSCEIAGPDGNPHRPGPRTPDVHILGIWDG